MRIWLSCAFVRRTLPTEGLLSSLSLGDEHPVNMSATNIASANRRSERLSSIGAAVQVGSMPPTAAKRLEQSRGVGKAAGLGLNKAEPGLLVCLFGVQHSEICIITILVAKPRKIEAGLGGIRRCGRGLHSFCVMLERAQRVGDILKSDEHRSAILLRRLL